MIDFIKITSKDNDTIKSITRLQSSAKQRKEEGVFVLEGLRLCMDAYENGFNPLKVFVSETASVNYSKEISCLCRNCCSYLVADSLFNKISDTVTPQGILCIYSIPDFDSFQIKTNGRYIALDNLQDPSNLGAISRTAEALGIDGLFIQGGCDPYSPKSLRASMGALLRIPVVKTDDMFSLFKKYDLKTFATVIDKDAVSVDKDIFSNGCVVIIGNEANGVSAETRSKSEVKITIPMSGKAESLNAAVAASIVMWEMCK